MADTKITALAAITTVDPAADVLPIVDISDTSMAASGTTKKITSNQILGAGGTATLASATITGDLTVDTSTLKVDSTNNRVGIVNATPSFTLDVNGAGSSMCARISSGSGTGLRFDTTRNVSGLNRNYLIGPDLLNEGWFSIIPSTALGGGTFTNSIYNASSDGIHAWGNGAGGELMRLNSTGLGVGVTPAQKLTVLTNVGVSATTATAADDRLIFTENMASADLGSQIVWKSAGNGNAYASIGFTNGAAGNNGSLIFSTSSSIFGSNNVERMRIDSAGNLILQSSATPATLGTNGMLTVNATSNTNLRFSYRGSDGTTRVANITLA